MPPQLIKFHTFGLINLRVRTFI